MTTETVEQTRELPARRLCQTRDDDGEGGQFHISGVAIPWDEVIVYGGQRETFRRGSVDPDSLPGRPLLFGHKPDEPIGHLTGAKDREDGLYVEAVIQPTARGKDVATLMRGGSLRGLSVGFQPETQEIRDGVTVWTSATVRELSITPLNAYPSALIETHTRNAKDPEMTAPVPAIDTAAIDELATRMDQLETQLHQQPEAAPQYLGVMEAFTRQIAASAEERRLVPMTRALSAGNPGLLPPNWDSEVLGYVDGNRYLVPRVGKDAFPSSGISLVYPVITGHTTVAARGAEASDLPESAFTTSTDTFNAEWYAGKQAIAAELLWQSSPNVASLVVRDLARQYGAATDTAVTTGMVTVGTANKTGAALDFTDYGTFVAQVIDTAEEIRQATGEPGDALMLTTADWKSLLGLVDADGRRVLSTVGSSNADGSAGITSQSVNVAGVSVFHSPRTDASCQFAPMAYRVAEKAPTQLTSLSASDATQTIGMLGALILLPLYAEGVAAYVI